jgi:hypothetical protein
MRADSQSSLSGKAECIVRLSRVLVSVPLFRHSMSFGDLTNIIWNSKQIISIISRRRA